MNEKSNTIIFFAFFIAGLIGLYYGYSTFVEPYVLEAPSDSVGAPVPEWAMEPPDWGESREFKFRSTYDIPDQKSGVIDLHFD